MTTHSVLITYTLSPASADAGMPPRSAAPIPAPVLKKAARASARLILAQLGQPSCTGCQRPECQECAVFGAPSRPSPFIWSAGQWEQATPPDAASLSPVASTTAPLHLLATTRSAPALPPPSGAAIALLLAAVLHLDLSLPPAKRTWQRLQATITSALIDGTEVSLDTMIGQLTEGVGQ